MAASLTCPQCQAALKLVHAPVPGVGVTCPSCRLKFVPPAVEAVQASPQQGRPLVGVMVLAVALGLAVAGVVLHLQSNRDPAPGSTEEKPASNGAGQGQQVADPPAKGAAGDKSKPDAPAKKYLDIELPDDPLPKLKKPAAKTYAETKPAPLNELPKIAAVPVVQPQPELPAHPRQKEINEAIDKGVRFLKDMQHPTGTWPREVGQALQLQDFHVGYAALAGLTLLECQVPPDDPAVQKVADFIRKTPISDHRTYQLACAVLFLERLADPRDRALVQGYALELVSGQAFIGMWTYDCPHLTPLERQQLLTILEATRLPAPESTDREGLKEKDDRTEKAPKPRPTLPPYKNVSQKFAMAPAVLQGYFPKTPLKAIPGVPITSGDNSNSQFAMLALWSARRHGVPTERCLVLAGQRYAFTQNVDGGWPYNAGEFPSGDSTATMTCVGLLGLAMGHGVLPPVKGANTQLPENPVIARGLQKLGGHVDAGTMSNFYFLWSLERVAVLYNLKTLGNKDWYDVGVNMLLPLQRKDGRWVPGNYPGSTVPLDTCFALLFLKRSNLVRDLSDRLPFLMAIQDPAARSSNR